MNNRELVTKQFIAASTDILKKLPNYQVNMLADMVADEMELRLKLNKNND